MRTARQDDIRFRWPNVRSNPGNLDMAKQNEAVAASGHPAMDYPAHDNTYSGFITAAKWCGGAIIAILVLMALFLL